MGAVLTTLYKCTCDKCKKVEWLESQPITIKRSNFTKQEYYCKKCLPEVLGLTKNDTVSCRSWLVIRVCKSEVESGIVSDDEMINVIENGGSIKAFNYRDDSRKQIFKFTKDDENHKYFKRIVENLIESSNNLWCDYETLKLYGGITITIVRFGK